MGDQTLQSKARVKLVDLLSEGRIKGLVNGDRSIFLNGVPLQNEDESYNFQGIEYELRDGRPDQAYLPGFADISSPSVVFSTKVRKTLGPVVKNVTTSPDHNAVILYFSSPGMYSQASGGFQPTAVSYRIERKSTKDLGWVNVYEGVISGKTMSRYQWSKRVELPTPSLALGETYSVQVRVTRLTDDNEGDAASALLQNDLYWDQYATIIDKKIRYADSAVVGMSIDSRLFGDSIPDRAFEIYGIMIQVPTGYDPEARTYPSFWDGTFQAERQWSDNPAWVFYDLCMNNRYGLAEAGDVPQVDKWTLYEISRICDELVPDGFGGLEPRFTFNGVINTREDAYKVLTTLAGLFRAMLYWSQDGLTAAADMPSDDVKLVTPSDVLEGKFTYSGSALRARHSVALVTWNDPGDNFQPAVEVVEDPEAIARFGWQPMDVAASWTKSQGQARRAGAWALDTEQTETDTVTYRASWDHADVGPGKFVDVADPNYMGLRRGGRVKGAAALSVELDGPVTIVAGETYQLGVTTPEGGIAKRDVTNSPGSYTVLSLASSLSETDIPIPGAQWLLYGSDANPRRFRVIGSIETEANIFQITGLFHDPTKLARIEQGLSLQAPAYSTIPRGAIAPPTNLQAVEFLIPTGAGYTPGLAVTWTPSTDSRTGSYEVEIRRPDAADYESAGRTQDVSWTVRDGVPKGGAYSFRVRALDGLGGRTSAWAELAGVVIEGKTIAPSDVDFFQARAIASGVEATWSPIDDIDAALYRIKLGADWTGELVFQGNATRAVLPLFEAGPYILKLKAVDANGNESAGAITTTVTIAAPEIPTVTYALVKNVLRFAVVPHAGSYPLGNTLASSAGETWSVSSGTLDAPVNWTGQRVFTFASGDIHGNVGPTATVTVNISAVTAPTGLSIVGVPRGLDIAVAFTPAPSLEAVELWEAVAEDFAQATKIDESAAGTFARRGLPLIATRWYWAICRDIFGNRTAHYPAGATAGVRGDTSTDPAYITALLAGALSEDELTQDLVTKVNAHVDVGDRLNNAEISILSLQEADGTLSSQISSLVSVSDQQGEDIATVQQDLVAATDPETGTVASYILRLNANGHISGFGIETNGDYSSMVFQADKFILAQPDGSLSDPPFYVGPLPDGGTGIVLRGDIFTPGSLVGNAIAARSIRGDHLQATAEILLDDGGILRVGNDNILLDSVSNSLVVSPDGGPVAGNDFCRLAQGDIEFFIWDGTQHRSYKSLRRSEYGTALNNTWVTLPGYWQNPPQVMVSANTLTAYDPAYAAQKQVWSVRADQLQLTGVLPGQYKFLAIAALSLGAASGEMSVNTTSGVTATNTYTSAETSTQSNCTSITAKCSVSSVRGTGTAPNYYYRQVRWRVGYSSTSGGTRTWTSYQTRTVGATLSAVADQMLVNFPSAGKWYFVIDSIAEDAGGTFSTGGASYNYSTGSVDYNPGSKPSATSTNSIVASATATRSVYTPASGWEIYEVDELTNYSWNSNAAGNGNAKTGSSNVLATAFGVGNISGATSSKVFSTNTFATNITVYAQGVNGAGVSCTFTLNRIQSTIKIRQLITNSATPSNQFDETSFTYVLTTAQVIDASGVLTYSAVGS